jgi:alpha,alpha-trehalase
MIKELIQHTEDEKWLKEQMPKMEKFYNYYTSCPHLIGDTELSQLSTYHALGDRPDVEVGSELDFEGKSHCERVASYYRSHPDDDYGYDVGCFFDRSSNALTPLFYKGDRSMRESGFDPSCRFGKFNVDIIHYAPVCLNSLLYQMELDMAHFSEILAMKDDITTM